MVLIPVHYTRFKLHLRPKALASSHIHDDNLPALPPNKSAEQILRDCLYASTKTYIKETHPGGHGPAFWKSVENRVEYVLSLPNGWEGQLEQAQMRRASLVANETQAHDRISLMSALLSIASLRRLRIRNVIAGSSVRARLTASPYIGHLEGPINFC